MGDSYLFSSFCYPSPRGSRQKATQVIPGNRGPAMKYPSPSIGLFTNPGCYVSATLLAIAGCVAFSAIGVLGQQATSSGSSFPLDSVAGLEVFNRKAEVATYRGRRAVHLTAPPGR